MRTFGTRRLALGVAWAGGLVLVGCLVYAWETEIAPIDVPPPDSFAPAEIKKGAQLVALGACITCHTAPDGSSLAGGRAVPTPFGAIYATNITPEPETGIGRWSLLAFRRAMRSGVDREGRHLYPAFPYDHFTLLNDADDAALYAFLMTRTAVRAPARANHLPFPLNIRWVIAGWKLLYLREGPYHSDPAHDQKWNRGAYLTTGISHCGACHTPRNNFGAENHAQQFAGGDSEGWHAYAINNASQARVHWDAAALHAYLRKGWHEMHGDAHGPMAPVSQNLGAASDADVEAIAQYVAWVMKRPADADHFATESAADVQSAGGMIYAAACAACHDGVRPLPFGGVRLTLSTAVTGESALNLINVILQGLHPDEGTAGAIMPGFASTLTDAQLESLVTYVRTTFGGKPPWPGLERSVRTARNRDYD